MRQGDCPEINEIVKFEDSISFVKGYELAVIPVYAINAERIKTVLKDNAARSAIVFIGPKGFYKDEVKAARGKGSNTVSLGKEVLRSDTAAISVLSV